MGTKHTPGPWDWHAKLSASENHRGFVIRANGSRFQIADVSPLDEDGDEGRANTLLIAAAPELLEAANLVLSWYEAEEDHSKADFYQRMDMCRASETAIRNAIAKATGASNGN